MQRILWFLVSIYIYFPLLSLGAEQALEDQAGFNIPPPVKSIARYQLYATNYYVYPAKSTKDGVRIRSIKGDVLSDPISSLDYCFGGVEGSILTTLNGKAETLNFHKVSNIQHTDCKVALKGKEGKLSPEAVRAAGYMVYYPAKNTYGDDVKSRALVPYRTIAVDPSIIPMGSIIYIPAARKQSITLPNGKNVFHDGYFIAYDNGGTKGVSGNHIDIFCGLKKHCLTNIADTGKTFEAMTVELLDKDKKMLTTWTY
ncbi:MULTISPECIES: 3D domain-containing protein [Klebsiella]|uniref:3D domain-containing protein n=1 Tax=Klebsiella TaxID=570 RepID=UPI000B3E4F25|nr:MULTISPECIES: 3D domain-containing protein [Klebsiella]AXO69573.1 hypothetical protein BC497_05405 [Klebsiella variicola]ELA2827313.1 hypothetical protein [Klebsiella variicola]EMA4735098.1 hypothetical protein [Klebsiella variicola]MCE0161197.1 hypothetical protein [Klebsiella variicola subsp. variicola]MCJ6764011.1 hypothetical protein [Klebsiella variicola]